MREEVAEMQWDESKEKYVRQDNMLFCGFDQYS